MGIVWVNACKPESESNCKGFECCRIDASTANVKYVNI